jgi:hypothetical protein
MEMTIAREEEHTRLITIFQCRNEAGLQALRAQLFAQRDKINNQWFNQTGETLISMAGEARAIAQMIKTIDVAPKISEGVNHG